MRYYCPTCGAEPHTACTDVRGRHREPHKDRFEAHIQVLVM